MCFEVNKLLMILFCWCTVNFVLVVYLLAQIYKRMLRLEAIYIMQVSLSQRGKKNMMTDIDKLMTDLEHNIEKQADRAKNIKDKVDKHE